MYKQRLHTVLDSKAEQCFGVMPCLAFKWSESASKRDRAAAQAPTGSKSKLLNPASSVSSSPVQNLDWPCHLQEWAMGCQQVTNTSSTLPAAQRQARRDDDLCTLLKMHFLNVKSNILSKWWAYMKQKVTSRCLKSTKNPFWLWNWVMIARVVARFPQASR